MEIASYTFTVSAPLEPVLNKTDVPPIPGREANTTALRAGSAWTRSGWIVRSAGKICVTLPTSSYLPLWCSYPSSLASYYNSSNTLLPFALMLLSYSSSLASHFTDFTIMILILHCKCNVAFIMSNLSTVLRFWCMTVYWSVLQKHCWYRIRFQI